MKKWSQVIILLVLISLGLGFGGYLLYKKSYVKPRAELAEQRQQLEQQIQYGKNQINTMTSATTALETLYTRSLPLRPDDAVLQYEIWLSQMLEFCNVTNARIDRGTRAAAQNFGYATQSFRVQAECELIDVAQFLYEFYWTPFLQRITALDMEPIEGSDKLKVTMTIDGLTITYRPNPNQPFPLLNKLPLDASAPKQLASGPFACYSKLGEVDFFRAVRPGIDLTALVKLTGTPIITDENGRSVKFSRWNFEADGKTQSFKIGEQLKVGAFVADVLDIDDNLVVLRQKNGRLWVVTLGSNLSDALPVPANMF